MNRHADRVHAILSASAAERWLNCTPSARLEEPLPDNSGEAAKEGQLAHELAELLLKKELKRITPQKFKSELMRIEKNELYNIAMWEYCENYAVFVMERYAEARGKNKDAQIFLETKVNLTEYVPEGFGTVDVGIIADHLLDIIDFKYGKGVSVTAEENKQMKLYALGWLDESDYLYDLHTIRLTIYQPRLDNISVFEMPTATLRAWATDFLIPRAALAFEGKGEFNPGSHCQFCKVRATCRANRDFNMTIVRHDFKDPALLDDNEVAELLSREKLFTSWIKSVNEFALDEALNRSKKWPGFKLVEGRSNRKYSDEEKVVATLIKAGFESTEIYKPMELQGIGEMEKIIGKADFQTLLSPLLIKPPGKPTLAPATDKRPELNSAEAAKIDFAITE